VKIERARVGEVLRLERRPVQVELYDEYVEIGVRSFGRGIFHKEPAEGAALGNKRVFRIEPDDLVISNVFAWEGAIAVASEGERGVIGSHRFMTFVPADERLDIRWASWFFRSELGLELIRRASPGSAGRNRTLAIDRFEALEIPLPTVEEQRLVAARLDHVQAAATNLRHRAANAAVLTDALSVSMASRRDLDDSGRRAAGWRRERLGAVMKPASVSVRVDLATEYPNVGIYSFGRGLFEKPPVDGASTSAATLNRIAAGQFVYSRLFAFEGAYAYVSHEFDGYYVSNEFPAFDTDPDELDARWLATVLRSPDRWTELGGRSKGLGVRRQRVPVEAVLDYEVWLPPIAEQRSMVASIRKLDQAASHRGAVTSRVDALLPAALNEVFAGLS
jgi:type I restriction enzyme S subunit